MCMEVGVYSSGFAQMFLILSTQESRNLQGTHGFSPSDADNLKIGLMLVLVRSFSARNELYATSVNVHSFPQKGKVYQLCRLLFS